MVSYINVLFYGIGGIVVAGMALLVAFQEKLVYVPVLPGLTKSYPITPARLRLLYEDVWLRSSDGVRLHAWFIKLLPDSRSPTILFFQENAGNIAHRLEMVRIMIQRLQCNVYMLSYRGYGASDGYPSQHGITMDAQAVLDHLVQRSDVDTSRIVVFGRSLGGAVGAVLTKNNPDKLDGLILENTFTSILDMAGVLLPFLKWFIGGSGSKHPRPLNFLVRSPSRTIDVVGEIKQPILFLSGLQDEMVPPSHMQMLYAKAAARNSRCSFVEFPNGMHMDTWLAGGDQYWKTIQEFLEQTVLENSCNGSSTVIVSQGDRLGCRSLRCNSQVQAASSQLPSSNSMANVNNLLNSAPATSSAGAFAGLLHQNSMNSRQQNPMNSANSPYGGNNLQMPSPSSSSTMPQPQYQQ